MAKGTSCDGKKKKKGSQSDFEIHEEPGKEKFD